MDMNSNEIQIVNQIVLLVVAAVMLGFIYG